MKIPRTELNNNILGRNEAKGVPRPDGPDSVGPNRPEWPYYFKIKVCIRNSSGTIRII